MGSDLSTSTKSVVDLDGGDVEPGDTLQYTINLFESAGRAATGVALEAYELMDKGYSLTELVVVCVLLTTLAGLAVVYR